MIQKKILINYLIYYVNMCGHLSFNTTTTSMIIPLYMSNLSHNSFIPCEHSNKFNLVFIDIIQFELWIKSDHKISPKYKARNWNFKHALDPSHSFPSRINTCRIACYHSSSSWLLSYYHFSKTIMGVFYLDIPL
jgi:hypothetical protein